MKDNGTIEYTRPYPSPNPNVRMSEVTYWSTGYRVKGMLAEPAAEGIYDGIVYLRGGIQHVGMVRPSRIAQFAQQGFTVFAPYYRGNRGGEGFDEFGGEDRFDAVHAVDVLKQHQKTDSARIHLFSFSRGGIMALWTAIIRNDITSVVNWAGVSDVVFTYKERKELRRMMKRVIGGSPNSAPDEYRNRTALFHVDEIDAPFLLVHGRQDVNVSIEQAIMLEDALNEAGKPVETWYFSDYTHFFPPAESARVTRDLCNWMKGKGN
ncbi:prolyl oligopeptidase family serine peptidase [Bhargavaea ginsengi]|uniref:alpha/beta hydrolase family protein n=1 Tax=Bhargavaea ginsengi TaxID=426757 RepID=UPI00203AE8B8|nr:prolyl oligopeptidase family serine peptidase [Bhargavaea ginsengi]MCM3086323.1 prolyl oligopeptidase family serine peptidase [Bhargavaea ginsengi]